MPTPYAPGAGSCKPDCLAEECVRQLEEDARAIAAVRLGAGCAAVTEVDERLDALFNDRMGWATGDPGDERHPAGIVLDGSIEQTSIRGLSA